MRVASGYANRTESLSLFGSYSLYEASQLVDGLFGKSIDRKSIASTFENRPVRLHPSAEVTDGFTFFRGRLRKSPRVVNKETQQYMDLHPGEDSFLELLNGGHNLDYINRVATRIRELDPNLPLRTGTELVVQLNNIGLIT